MRPHGIPTINLAINRGIGGLFHPIAIKQADSFLGAQGRDSQLVIYLCACL